MEIIINTATVNDVKKANDFLTRLIQDEKQYDRNINENLVIESLYENLITNDNNCVLLAKVNEEIVGYLFGFIEDSNTAYLERKAKLEAMFVDENFRGNKIGKLLIEEFKTWVQKKECKYIELSVCKENTSAINLYKKEGFKDLKTIMITELQ